MTKNKMEISTRDMRPDYALLAKRNYLSPEDIALIICDINPDSNMRDSYGSFSGPDPLVPRRFHMTSWLCRALSETKKKFIQDVFSQLYDFGFVNPATPREIAAKLENFSYKLPDEFISCLKSEALDLEKNDIEEVSSRESNNNKKRLGLLILKLASKSASYLYGNNVNSKKIKEDLLNMAEKLGVDDDGLKSFDREMSEAIHFLETTLADNCKNLIDRI